MKKIIKVACAVLFSLYLLVLIYLLFFKPNDRFHDYTLLEYIKNSSNIIPFKTVAEYIEKLSSDQINTSSVIYNLVGNLILFAPMGFFVPILFKKISDFKKIALLSVVVILVVEVLQMCFMVGHFDIDDIILNTVGAFFGYGAYKLLSIEKLKI